MTKKADVFQMRTSPEFIASLDDWRRRQADLPSRAESIRRLVEDGLHAHAQREREEAALKDAGFPYNAGKQAAIDGKPHRDIPYTEPKHRELWLLGYIDGMTGRSAGGSIEVPTGSGKTPGMSNLHRQLLENAPRPSPHPAPTVGWDSSHANKHWSYEPARQVIATILLKEFSRERLEDLYRNIDPATCSEGMFSRLMSKDALRKFDFVLSNPPPYHKWSEENRVELGELEGAPLFRPDIDSTRTAAEKLAEVLAASTTVTGRLFLAPVNNDRDRKFSGKTAYRAAFGAVVAANDGLVLFDRPALVLPPGHHKHGEEMRQVFEAAMHSGKPFEIAKGPLSVDTAVLPADEALRAIGKAEYEPMKDFSQIERLSSMLAA